MSSWSALISYLKLTRAHCEREAFRMLFLDKKNQPIAGEMQDADSEHGAELEWRRGAAAAKCERPMRSRFLEIHVT